VVTPHPLPDTFKWGVWPGLKISAVRSRVTEGFGRRRKSVHWNREPTLVRDNTGYRRVAGRLKEETDWTVGQSNTFAR
jgi:hypothetical protein